MTTSAGQVHPHDVGLPKALIRKRRRFRRIGYLMLLIAACTALPGWFLYGVSIWGAFTVSQVTLPQAIIAYSLLIVSSITLVLGLWYLLLAQVRRLARVVEGGGEQTSRPPRLCANCGWSFDESDRFCRHCGKPLEKRPSG